MFWPFPILRNYSSNADLSAVFRAFAFSEDLEITHHDRHKLEMRCSHGRLNFWNENKPYAWASRGIFTPSNGAGRFTWSNEMPDRWSSLMMSLRVKSETPRFKLPEGTLE